MNETFPFPSCGRLPTVLRRMLRDRLQRRGDHSLRLQAVPRFLQVFSSNTLQQREM